MVMGKVVKVQISVVKGQELASVFFCIGQQRVQTHHIVAEHKGVKVGRVIDVGQSVMAQGHLEHDLGQASLCNTVYTQALCDQAVLIPVGAWTTEIELKASGIVISLGFRGQAVTADFVFAVCLYPLLSFKLGQ